MNAGPGSAGACFAFAPTAEQRDDSGEWCGALQLI